MRLIRTLVYSNFFVAWVLTVLTTSTYFIIDDLVFHWFVPVSVFIGSFVLYSFHRLYKIDFIPENQLAPRHQWVLKNASLLKYTMSFAVFVQLLIMPNFNADTIVWIIPAGIISAGYTIPVLPASTGWYRFRDIPLAKPLIISLVASYLTFGLPVFEQFGIEALFSRTYFPLFAERILFLLIVTIPFELRDISNDRESGLNTLGTQFGFERSRQVGYFLMICWFGEMLFQALNTRVHLGLVVFSAISFILLILLYRWMNERWSELRFTLVFEGAIMLYAVGLVLASRFHSIA